ncbi:hypothetical protein GGR57DRAFT_351881 [Xylariaceae sp. FL1272]|nr:hypothetical protein GGR57DRAFT_351881 [Xylariaceae sp. FL1272]
MLSHRIPDIVVLDCLFMTLDVVRARANSDVCVSRCSIRRHSLRIRVNNTSLTYFVCIKVPYHSRQPPARRPSILSRPVAFVRATGKE